MGRKGYVFVSLLAGLALAAPALLFALDTGPAEAALARGFLAAAVAAGLSWLPLWPAGSAARAWGYWAGLPLALAGAALYAVAAAYLLPVSTAQAGAAWLLLWWPALAGPGPGARLAGWLLLLAAGALAWWRAPAAWAGVWPWVLAFNALLSLLYTPLPAKRPAGTERNSSGHRLRG